MKLHLPSFLRAALLACFAFPSTLYAASFVADGVDVNNVANSERFYDSMKGYYLSFDDDSKLGTKLGNELQYLYATTGSMKFLGDLYEYIPEAYRNQPPALGTETTFSVLADQDENMCWAYAASNALQYWQSYYGIFASEPDKLVYGFTYDKDYVARLNGIQSLKLNIFFFENWLNEGGWESAAFSWYLTGDVEAYFKGNMEENHAEAGFFSDYFTNLESAERIFVGDNTTLAETARALAQALGCELNAAGKYEQVTAGQIACLGIYNSKAGHAVTCYGFTTDADGNLETLLLANSDDPFRTNPFELATVYVRIEEGDICLYYDKEFTKSYYDYHLREVSYINTPDSLKQLYAEYSDPTKPLYWNGKSVQWGDAEAPTISEQLPTASTGWVADAGGDTYASYYDASRPVMFDDRAAGGNRSVRLAGNVATPSMSIHNATGAYSFAGNGHSITTDALSKSGSWDASFRDVQLKATQTSINGGWFELQSGSSLRGSRVDIVSMSGNAAGLRFNGGTATITNALTLGAGGTLEVALPTTISAATLDFQKSSTLSLYLNAQTPDTPVLTLDGRLLFDAAATLNIHFTNSLGSERNFTLASVSGGMGVSSSTECYLSASLFDAGSYSAELQLSADGLTLHMVLVDVASRSWHGGNGTWNTTESNWASSAAETTGSVTWEDGAYVHFNNESTTVSVANDVSAYALRFNGGEHSLSGADKIAVSRRIILADGAQVTLDAAHTLSSGMEVDIAAGSHLSINSGDVALRGLSNEGTLSLGSGSLSLSSEVEQGGSVEVAQTLSLADYSHNNFQSIAAGTLLLGEGSSVAVDNILATGTISRGSISETAAITTGSLGAGSVNFVLSAAAQQSLTSLGLVSSNSIALLQAGSLGGNLSLTVGGANSITVGSYDYIIGTEGTNIVLTAYRTGMSRWSSTDGSWQWTGDAPAPGIKIGFLGEGTSEVSVAADYSVADILVEAGNGKAYTTSGQGTLTGSSLSVTSGSMDLGHSATVVEGDVTIGAQGILSVQEGSRLDAATMSLRADNGFANAGTTVVTGALSATGMELSNSGSLSVGSGTQIGALTGAGELHVTGDASIVRVPELSELSIANGATLSVRDALTVTGNFTGTGYLKGNDSITLQNVTTQGGSISANVVALAGAGNQLGELETSILALTGELTTATPMLTVDTIKAAPAGVAAMLTRQSGTQNSLVISLSDTDAAQGSYELIQAIFGVKGGRIDFTLLPETQLAFQRNRLEATLGTNADTLTLNLAYSVKGVYGAACHSANGVEGARLLDELFYKESSLPQTSDKALRGLMEYADACIIAGDHESLDRTAAAVAGSSIPVLSLAFASDMQRQMRAVRNRTTTMGVDSRYEHPELPYINAWINAEGGYRKFEGDATAAGYELCNWGGSVGVDVDAAENLTLGFAFTSLYGDLTSTGLDAGKGELDTYYASLFARVPVRSWVHTFVMTAGMADMSLERTVRHGAGMYSVKGDTTGYSVGALYEMAYTISLSEDEDVCWQPLFTASYVHTAVDSYAEEGSSAALDAGKQTLDQFSVGVGARLQAIVGENLYNRSSMLELRALARADLGDRMGKANTSFSVLPGATARMESHENEMMGLELGAGLVVPVGADGGELFFDVSSE